MPHNITERVGDAAAFRHIGKLPKPRSTTERVKVTEVERPGFRVTSSVPGRRTIEYVPKKSARVEESKPSAAETKRAVASARFQLEARGLEVSQVRGQPNALVVRRAPIEGGGRFRLFGRRKMRL